MIDIDQLPVPDWGLHCPNCDAPLAGARLHRCGECGQPYNIRQLLDAQRPIPDLDLTCPECDYLLTGLTGARCPECGSAFSVREMLEEQSLGGVVSSMQLADPHDHHVKKREPTFTGHERPLSDFGLSCSHCDHSLAEAPADVCPACGLEFDLFAIVPEGDWVHVSEFIPARVDVIAKGILYAARIPYVLDNARLSQMYSGRLPILSSGVRVPREFFFDALHVLAEAEQPPAAYAEQEWICPACDECVPTGFEVCWNCNGPHPDRPDDEDG